MLWISHWLEYPFNLDMHAISMAGSNTRNEVPSSETVDAFHREVNMYISWMSF